MKDIILLIAIFALSFKINAQNEGDVYRYAKHYHSGSARFEAMGGAFGALGGDLSAGQINPAGLGRFSNSYFTFSMGPTFNTTKALFNGNSTSDNRASFSVPNFGLLIATDQSEKNRGNMYSQVGIGMNRIANFNQNLTYTGDQYASLLDIWTSQAKGYAPSELNGSFPFSTDLAWQTYAIDYDSGSNSYYSQLNAGDVTHSRSVNTKGGVNEWFLSYSCNRMNKLYYGGLISYQTSNYSEQYTHSENLTDTTTTTFRGFDYDYNLKTKGAGVNLKVGAIYMVTDAFRIGGAFHSPTFSDMTDEWSATMVSRFSDTIITIPADWEPTGKYKYRLNTPLRLIASTAYVIGLRGVISADVEYVGYGMGRLRGTTDTQYETYNFKEENKVIKERLTSALNIRLGTEFNIQQIFFLRAGFSYYGNAFKKDLNVELKPDIAISGGLGYRFGIWSIDVSYVNRSIQRNYYAFAGSTTTLNTQTNMVTVTGSVRF